MITSKKMYFWGYNNEKEAREYWPNLDKGKKSEKMINVSTRSKKCVGSLDGKNYLYEDKTTDTGEMIKETTIILGNNIIKF